MQRRTSGEGWKLEWVPDIKRAASVENKPCVYFILCKPTNIGYIGSTMDVYERLKYHFSRLATNKHPNYKLRMAFAKHGVDAFTWGIVEFCPQDMLAEREQYWIDRYPPERLFNIESKVKREYPYITVKNADLSRYLVLAGISESEANQYWGWRLIYDLNLLPEYNVYWEFELNGRHVALAATGSRVQYEVPF